MLVSGPGAPPYSTQSVGMASARNEPSDPSAADRAGSADSAKSAGQAVTSYSPLVSDAANAVLLRFQETGSVFGARDARFMQVREVSAADQQRFAEIIQDAAAQDGYSDPVGYIKSLPAEDIEILRRVHSIAETRGVTQTTREGATNLLLPPQNHVDTNNDAIVDVGAARTFVFPPPNAPQAVKDAWEETTRGMSERERLLGTTSFLTITATENLEVDGNGKAVGFHEPGDPEYKNPFGATVDAWESMLSDMIAGSKSMESKDSRYAQQTALLTKFRDNLLT